VLVAYMSCRERRLTSFPPLLDPAPLCTYAEEPSFFKIPESDSDAGIVMRARSTENKLRAL